MAPMRRVVEDSSVEVDSAAVHMPRLERAVRRTAASTDCVERRSMLPDETAESSENRPRGGTTTKARTRASVREPWTCTCTVWRQNPRSSIWLAEIPLEVMTSMVARLFLTIQLVSAAFVARPWLSSQPASALQQQQHSVDTAATRVSPLLACAAPTKKSRAQVRLRQKAVRDLKHAMVLLNIPGNAATLYAETLASRDVSTAEQLTKLSNEDLDACDMRGSHRQLIKSSGLLLRSEESSQAADPLPPTAAPPAASADASDESLSGEDEGDQELASVVVPEGQDNKRVDAVLAALLPPLSRSYFSALCGEGRVSVDGLPAAKKSLKVAAGATLVVRLRAAAELTVSAEAIDLNVRQLVPRPGSLDLGVYGALPAHTPPKCLSCLTLANQAIEPCSRCRFCTKTTS